MRLLVVGIQHAERFLDLRYFVVEHELELAIAHTVSIDDHLVRIHAVHFHIVLACRLKVMKFNRRIRIK